MRALCGVCHGHSHDSPLMCAACANFVLLRPRLEYLEALRQSSEAKALVDSVLSKCIKGQNFVFVQDYITHRKSLAETPAATPTAKAPSEDSIAALSSQLLTIDAIVIKRRNAKIQRDINALKVKRDDVVRKLQEKKKEVEERRSQLASQRAGQEVQDKMKTLKNENLYKAQDNKNLIKQINNSRSLLFQELINIYIVKKRKISGTTRSIFMLSFTPILSTSNLAEFNAQTINACLERMSKFIHQISKVLLLTLPYAITFGKESFYKPSILSFDLFLKEEQQVWSMSTFELRALVNGIARLTIDVHYVLRFLELDEDVKDYSDLLRLDTLIFKLANNDYTLASSTTERDSEELKAASPVPEDYKLGKAAVDVDKLATMMFGVINKCISSKNNDWHFVKKEYLVDDE